MNGYGVVFGVSGGMSGGVSGGVAVGVSGGVAVGVSGGVAVGVAASLTVTRFIEWFCNYVIIFCKSSNPVLCSVVWLPLPMLRQRLEVWLKTDWQQGIYNNNQLLSYTLQFIPVISATNNTSTEMPEDDLLQNISMMIDNPYDWQLIQYGFVDLRSVLMNRVFDDFLFIPKRWLRRWRDHYSIDIRWDTPARAACAGFWLWHEEYTKPGYPHKAGQIAIDRVL